MKRFATLCAMGVLAVAIAVVAGCGGDATSTSDTTGPGGSGTPSTAKTVTLWVTAFATKDYDPVRREFYSQFEKLHPEVKIDYRSVQATDYYNKLQLQLASGKTPDVVFVENVFFPQYARKGLFVPLDTYIEKDKDFKLADFHQVGLDMYQLDGTQYCLPGNIGVFVLFYNQDMFDAEEIAFPDETWDWAKLLSVAQKLTKRDREGRITRFGMAFPPHYSLFLLQNNAKVYTDDYSRCIINNPEAKEAIQFCVDLADKHHVAPDLGQMLSYQSEDLFQVKKCAMMITGRWQVLPYRKVEGLAWDVAPLPRGNRRATLIGSHGWGISKFCKDPDVAWEFIKFITGPGGSKRVVDMGDCNPALKTLDEYFVTDATKDWPKEKNDNQIYVEALDYAYAEPLLHPWVPALQVTKLFADNIDGYREGRLTLDEALQNFQDTMNKLIEEKRPK